MTFDLLVELSAVCVVEVLLIERIINSMLFKFDMREPIPNVRIKNSINICLERTASRKEILILSLSFSLESVWIASSLLFTPPYNYSTSQL